MQIQYRDENGVIQLVRAGRAFPANPAPIRLFSNIGTGNGLNAGGRVSPFVANNPPANYNLWISVDVPRDVVPRFVMLHWDMNFAFANASAHFIHIYYGVWNTSTSAWESPIYAAIHTNRALPFQNSLAGNTNTAGAPVGTGNGQVLPSNYRNQFPIEVIPDVAAQAWQGTNTQLRFFMALFNNHATENITDSWRAWFTLLCF